MGASNYPVNFSNLCNKTAALALFECLGEEVPEHSFDEFTRQAQASYQETGSPVKYFSDRYRIQFEILDAKYHELLPVESITPLPQLPRRFREKIRGGHRVHLATHSHINFTSRSIPHLKLSDVFQLGVNAYTLDGFGHEHSKCKSPKMIEEAANNIGLGLEEVAFCEDTAKNFIPVKDKDHRVTTVLITWGRTPDRKPQGCDMMARDPIEALARMAPPRRMGLFL